MLSVGYEISEAQQTQARVESRVGFSKSTPSGGHVHIFCQSASSTAPATQAPLSRWYIVHFGTMLSPLDDLLCLPDRAGRELGRRDWIRLWSSVLSSIMPRAVDGFVQARARAPYDGLDTRVCAQRPAQQPAKLTHPLSAEVPCQPAVTLHHHVVPLVDVVAGGLGS
jgi:hypothetical protein